MTEDRELPPTLYLIVEVLAARARTGDDLWSFPSTLALPLRHLEDRGLVSVMHGIAPASLRARLTEEGRKYSLRPGFTPANGGIDRLRRALTYIAEFAEERTDIVIGMGAIASTARKALGPEGAETLHE